MTLRRGGWLARHRDDAEQHDESERRNGGRVGDGSGAAERREVAEIVFLVVEPGVIRTMDVRERTAAEQKPGDTQRQENEWRSAGEAPKRSMNRHDHGRP